MKITEIYRQYRILPNLQEHMLRVSAVAAYICDHFDGSKIDKSSVISATLLHDMGNIIKFDLTLYPELLGPKPLTFWEGVQVDFKERYGEDEHVATELIATELGVSERIKELIQAVSYHAAEENVASDDFEKKIAAYADLRVGLHGVITLEERLSDFTKRYAHLFSEDNEVKREKTYDALRQLEPQVFAYCNISPDEITNKAISGTIDSLKNFVVQTKN